jgi:hypothetical protein
MSELINFSGAFFLVIGTLAVLLHLFRTSPIRYGFEASPSLSWSSWLAEQIQQRAGIGHESFLARFARLSVLVTKYGVAAWTLFYPQYLSIGFWLLLWVLLLTLEILRKAAQFYIPLRWENVSLKLDSEHFWLIHLLILGTAETQLGGGPAWGLATLIICYMIFAGDSRPSILSAFEDVASCAWALIALNHIFHVDQQGIVHFASVLFAIMILRGLVRLLIGRAWIRRRFWWIAQFCLMTALIVKSLVVLNVLAYFNS